MSHRAKIAIKRMKERTSKKGLLDPVEWDVIEVEGIMEYGFCAISGKKFDYSYSTDSNNNPYAASPDRIDNSEGYTELNTQWVLNWINLARNDIPLEEFKQLLVETGKYISKHNK